MERKVGEVFEYEGFKYKVIANPDDAYNCANCSFDNTIGECAIAFRKENRDSVCFKRLED